MTTQIPDSFFYKKNFYPIYSEPLESILKNLELKSKLTVPNTACWRGYIASYSVIDNKLYLVEWTGYLKGEEGHILLISSLIKLWPLQIGLQEILCSTLVDKIGQY